MIKKGQVSIEFVVVIAIILVFAVVFASTVFESTDTIKVVAKIKLRTIDIFTATDSNAVLLRIDHSIVDSNIDFDLFIKDGSYLNLSDSNYSSVIQNIKDTTKYENISLNFNYS